MSGKVDVGKQEENSLNAVKTGISFIVKNEKVVIFSKTNCPWCKNTKEVFKNMGQQYSAVELNEHPRGEELQDALKEITGKRTVPRVFVDGKCIGGGSETVELFKSGHLKEILKDNYKVHNTAGGEQVP